QIPRRRTRAAAFEPAERHDVVVRIEAARAVELGHSTTGETALHDLQLIVTDDDCRRRLVDAVPLEVRFPRPLLRVEDVARHGASGAGLPAADRDLQGIAGEVVASREARGVCAEEALRIVALGSAPGVECRPWRERRLTRRVVDECRPGALADAGEVSDQVIAPEETAVELDVIDVDPVIQTHEASQVRGKTPLLAWSAGEVDATARRVARRMRILAVLVVH